MTVVSGLGGSSGAQTLAIVIRSIALGDFHQSEIPKLLLMEIKKGILNGIIVGFSSP